LAASTSRWARSIGEQETKWPAPEAVVLSEESKAEILKLRDEYPDAQSALLPALYLAQAGHGGWLPEEAFDELAAVLELPSTLVASVASFYTMLNRKPVGRHQIQVCTNISCSLLGGEHLLAYISRKLGIKPGETTPDGEFTLLEVECLGSCGTAPMMQVDDRYHERLTEEKIESILSSLAQDTKGR
jgi:NADH-quinone oxidoreductase E subunit